MEKKKEFAAKTIEGKTIAIEDEFIEQGKLPGDNKIRIKVDWSTYGDVAKWMVCYDKEDLDRITKENFEDFHHKIFFEWEKNMIRNSGIWLSTLYGTHEKFDAIDHDKRLPPDTPFTEIVAKGIKEYWDKKVRVISFYTGRQGLLSITVFDAEKGCAMFSFTSLELFGNFRAR